jgi:hypothetical protein
MPISFPGRIAIFSINGFRAVRRHAYTGRAEELMRRLKPILTCFRYLSIIVLSSCLWSHPAAAAGSRLQLEFHDNLINLSADNADIQNLLLKLNTKTGIFVKFPSALQKKITLELSDVTVEKALATILKGLNYATVYSMPSGAGKAQVSEIHIFNAYKGRSRSRRSARRTRLFENRIKSYENRIRSAQQRLARVPQDSQAGKRYQRQIASYQRTIERLKRQIR